MQAIPKQTINHGTNFLVLKENQESGLVCFKQQGNRTQEVSYIYSQIGTSLHRTQRIKINRLRIGHTKLTDFLISKEPHNKGVRVHYPKILEPSLIKSQL